MKISQKDYYGGLLARTRAGRKGPRPLSNKDSMHIVLRSQIDLGDRTVLKPLVTRFGSRHRIEIHSIAGYGCYLHLVIKVRSRAEYIAFIRAITSAIAYKLGAKLKKKFWIYRPLSRILKSTFQLSAQHCRKLLQWERKSLPKIKHLAFKICFYLSSHHHRLNSLP